MLQETSGLAYEEGEQDIPDTEHSTKRSQMDVYQESRIAAAKVLEQNLSLIGDCYDLETHSPASRLAIEASG